VADEEKDFTRANNLYEQALGAAVSGQSFISGAMPASRRSRHDSIRLNCATW
jgi:hypothetical protein